MKKKIGILTFHRADNIGAVLQAYALQSTLINDLGADAEIIDYRCQAVEMPSQKRRGIKGLVLKGYYLWKRCAFSYFRWKHLKMSSSVTRETIYQCADKYDAFLAGSDQIWNYECSGRDDTYFLDFAPPEKRFSFAASIGNYRFSKSEQDHIRCLLADFSGLSVRELSAKLALHSLGIETVDICCDPVFLLTRERWQAIMPGRRYVGKYVFVYLIQQDVNVMRSAQEYARKHNCKIISNKTSPEFILRGSPTDFLSWVYYSECVFTNSFHGTAFALLFGKPLSADIALASGEFNHRVKEILEETDTTNCICTEYTDHTVPNRGTQIKIQGLRDRAFCYLEELC